MTEPPVVPLPLRREPARPFDPDEELARLRAEGEIAVQPLPDGRFAWLVTRHADVRAVLSDPRFSNARTHPGMLRPTDDGTDPAAQDQAPPTGSLIMTDPPEHTRLRRMLTGEFTVKRMNRLRPRIEAIVAEHLDEMERTGPPADLVRAFALPVPSLVICELLGVPYADRADFQRRSHTVVDLTGHRDEVTRAFEEMFAYMSGLVAARRERPDDALLGMLVREYGDQLTDQELVRFGNLLLLAGHETTANMLSLGALLLTRHPEQLAALRGEPAMADRAVEELLRYLSVVNTGMARTAVEDVTVGGQPIKAGEIVMVSLPSANRDAELCGDPDRFDVTRRPTPHVAFGHGIHHCLGAPLARMEMRIALPALFRRFPGLRPAIPLDEIPFRTMSSIYGVDELPVTW